MKKTSFYLTMIIFSILFNGCSKTPFKEQEPLENSALVYIYVMPDDGINDTNRIPFYEVELNGIYTDGKMYPYEYLKFNIAKKDIEVSVKRNKIEKKSLKLSLAHRKTYFLKVQSFSDTFNGYRYELVEPKEALKEIVDTKYALYNVKDEEQDILVKEVENITPISKTDELRKAHQLKVDGLINEAEYQKLKAEILDAN